jgi:hypothetical protein
VTVAKRHLEVCPTPRAGHFDQTMRGFQSLGITGEVRTGGRAGPALRTRTPTAP